MKGSDEYTIDRFHAGRLQVLQPRTGYRAAIDPVFLAAALDVPRQGQRLLDVGCGAGVAGLCAYSLIQAQPEHSRPPVCFKGIDIDQSMLDLASESVRRNTAGIECGTFELEKVDIADDRTWPDRGNWDQVFSNPPYLEETSAQGIARPGAEMANMETNVSLAAWLTFMTRMLKNKGRLVLVHRADRLTEIVSVLRQQQVGSIEMFPLWPKEGRAAKRVIIRGRKGGKAPDRMMSGMVLHRSDGEFTEEARQVLNGDCWLPF